MTSLEPISYSTADAVRVSGLGRTKLFELLGSGQLKSVKIGRRRLVLAESLRAFLSGE